MTLYAIHRQWRYVNFFTFLVLADNKKHAQNKTKLTGE